MADEDDIKPDATDPAAEGDDVLEAAGDAPTPQEPEEGEVAEGAEAPATDEAPTEA